MFSTVESLLKRQQAVHHDESKFIQSAKEATNELQELFERQVAEALQSGPSTD